MVLGKYDSDNDVTILWRLKTNIANIETLIQLKLIVLFSREDLMKNQIILFGCNYIGGNNNE